jgi:catechol 2,3-dioxygenase-like lactoylglutathione lyase family enzyme
VKARADGMWWGVAIEAPDAGALGRFYADLTGWPVGHQEEGTVVLAPPQGQVFVVFQTVPDYVAPAWPGVEGKQHTMMHLDVEVADLDAAMAEATELGARVADHQPQENVRVMLDPAGHPFCLCLDA